MQRLVPEWINVRTRGGDGGRIRCESGSGTFEFAASDLPLGKTVAARWGDASVERLPVEEKLSEAGSADDYPALAFTPGGVRWVAWLCRRKWRGRVLARGGGQTYELTPLRRSPGSVDHSRREGQGPCRMVATRWRNISPVCSIVRW